MHNGIETEKVDQLLAETCAYLNMLHPDYSKLAARVAVSRLHKYTKSNFADYCTDLLNYKDVAGNLSLFFFSLFYRQRRSSNLSTHLRCH